MPPPFSSHTHGMPHLTPKSQGATLSKSAPGRFVLLYLNHGRKSRHFESLAVSSQLRSQFRAHQAISGPPGAQAHCGRPRVDGVASPYACDRARGIFAGRQDGRMCTKGGLGGILTGQQDGRMCTKGGPGGPCRAGAWPHVHTFTEGRYTVVQAPSKHAPASGTPQLPKRR